MPESLKQSVNNKINVIALDDKPQVIAINPKINYVDNFRGMWLKNKLQNLYNDPKFKSGSPEQQKAWKQMAYNKWVSPYYKEVLKTDPPSLNQFLTRLPDKPSQLNEFITQQLVQTTETGLHTLKETSKITSGLLNDLSYVGKLVNDIAPEEFKPGGKVLEQIAKSGSQYMKGKEQVYSDRLDDLHSALGVKHFYQDTGKLAEYGTDALFFEATGAAKGTKLLRLANPKTASLAMQMGKASYNGAVEWGMWTASQGEKPKEVGEASLLGAVSGPLAKVGQIKMFDPLVGVFSNIFKFGGKESFDKTIQEIVTKANNEPSKSTVKVTPELEKTLTFAKDHFDKAAQANFKKNYDELPYIQKIHILNRMSLAAKEGVERAKEEGVPKQILQAEAKEQNEQIAKIFPEASQVQQNIDKFIQQNGEPPVQNKLLATLPHHNTTVDSPWKHLQARVNFLKMQLRTAKGSERKALQSALNEEYSLIREKIANQKVKGETSKGTVGGAAINDTRFFKDEYVVTPNIDPYNSGYGEWHTDSFAQGVQTEARRQAASKGQASNFIVNAIENSFALGAFLRRKAFLQEGINKQLFHPQYGLIGGINYEFQSAAGLGEHSGLNPKDSILYINYLGMRPNVVARIWPVKGGGQTLFLNAAMEAERSNAGIALIPFDESQSFYEKMGMKRVGSYMVMDKEQVKSLLKNKGLLMMLLGAGITYGSSKDLSDNFVGVKGPN